MNGRAAHGSRRNALTRLVAWSALILAWPGRGRAQSPGARMGQDDRRWIEAAFAMKRLAESWGDQSYGAVLVIDGTLAGEGPSRVVQRGDPDAHAEREAIKDAQKRLGRSDLTGAVLYSTSRPCNRCEQAAAEARVARMIYGADMRDAGPPVRR
jgi:tRNA(Arg) A34 adenosine deaminase TadA